MALADEANMARDIGQWLEGLDLGRYAEAFADNEIDLDALPHITGEDLKEIGVELGARRRLPVAPAAQQERGYGRGTPSGSAMRRNSRNPDQRGAK